jgi:low affinity Fe/Cu permease
MAENFLRGMSCKKSKGIKLDKMAEVTTKFIGSTASLVLHTFLFVVSFILPVFHLVTVDKMLLALTTMVSLEAIYLSIFIQMTVNKNTYNIEMIQDDVDEIQEDIEDIEQDIDEIQKDVVDINQDNEKDLEIEKREEQALMAIQTILTNLQNEVNSIKHKNTIH